MGPLAYVGAGLVVVLLPILEWLRRRQAAALEPMSAADWQRLAELPTVIKREERHPALDQRFTGTKPVDRKALKAALKFTHRRKATAKPRRLQIVPINERRHA